MNMLEAAAGPTSTSTGRGAHRDADNFRKVAVALRYAAEHAARQPSLDELADVAGISRSHFQRVFRRLAGVSPKKFVQYLSLECAKRCLRVSGTTVLDAALDAGLSGPGRLHDLFVRIEAMTPGEFKLGGEGLLIRYSHADTLFGRATVAATSKGVCFLAFADDDRGALAELAGLFPRAELRHERTAAHAAALAACGTRDAPIERVALHLRGTPFQLKVWEGLLRIPAGETATYRDVASALGRPTAARAVGAAIGRNAVAYLIPCHRVIRADGDLSGYRWGRTRKAVMLGIEDLALATNDHPDV